MAPPQTVTAKPGSKPQVSKKSLFDRDAAVAYAAKYWNMTCGDGVIALKSVPAKIVTPGVAFTNAGTNQERVEASSVGDGTGTTPILFKDMEDCTHFTSCCLGRPADKAQLIAQKLEGTPSAQWPREKSGGLVLPQEPGVGVAYTCGFVGAPKLVTYLKTRGKVIGKELQDASAATLPTEMKPGDVIAYGNNVVHNHDTDTDTPVPYTFYQHCTLHLGSGNIACHSASRQSSAWNSINLPFVTFIHITVDD